MRMRKKKWVRPFIDSEKEYLLDKFDGCDKPVYLEIGMGMGDFITESALQNKEIFYIGLEKDETCVARAIKKSRDNNLDNIKIMLVNAEEIQEVIKEKSIDRIYLHFSDPWPKKRYHKRRLTYPSFLEKYYQLLKDDGEIVFKTDNVGLFDDSLEYFEVSPFKIDEINRDYHSELIGEPMTGYQIKFSSLGQPIFYARLKKV